MNTLSSALRSEIIRRVEFADRREILVIASALCAGEVPDPSPPPAGRLTGPRFEALGESGDVVERGAAMVRDNRTGLIWTRENVPGECMEWKAAQDACPKLRIGGFSDWRLPTQPELLSIVDYGRSDPAIDPAFGCKADWYWSSTPYAPSPGGYAWSVRFGYGNAHYYDHDSHGFVRAVRAGQS